MKRVTIIGAGGFVGSRLVAQAAAAPRFEVQAVRRGDALPPGDLGIVLYAVGITADFRTRLGETVDAHVGHLREILAKRSIDELVYLSSTRVYRRSVRTTEESTLSLRSDDVEDLYALSKLLGEALTLQMTRFGKCVRLSNVFGVDSDSPNFLASIIRDAVRERLVTLSTTLDSEKDYIALEEAVDLILDVADRGRHRIYNVASGRNTTHDQILAALQRSTECAVSVRPDAVRSLVAPIDTTRIRSEFAPLMSSVLDAVPRLVEAYRRKSGRKS